MSQLRRVSVLLAMIWCACSGLAQAHASASQRLTAAKPHAPLAVSTFDHDREGWLTTQDATCFPIPCYSATGGNPGGYIYSNDTLAGIKFYFVAPAKFLGNKVGAYKQHLTFEMHQDVLSTVNQTRDADVILTGAGLTLIFSTPRTPPPFWYPYDVPLDETKGWRVGSMNGRQPTAAQMKSVLSSLTDLRIRGDYTFGQATCSLDNVVLGGPSVTVPNVYELILPIVSNQR